MQANVFQAAGLPIDRHIPTSLSVWVGLNVLDALLTLFLLGAGGVGGNPMLSAMQSEMGAVGMLFSKIGIAAIAGVALLTIPPCSSSPASSWQLSACTTSSPPTCSPPERRCHSSTTPFSSSLTLALHTVRWGRNANI